MLEEHRVLTPESVELRYEVAGVASRIISAGMDYLLIFLLDIVLTAAGTFGGLYLRQSGSVQDVVPFLGPVVPAVAIFLSFLSWFGYFILFELFWSGQTPGKRRGGLRAVRQDGLPLGAGAIITRNLLRAIDGFFGIGVIVMFISPMTRRFGDYAAGSIVVREPRGEPFTTAFSGVFPQVSDAEVQAVPHPERITAEHYQLLRDFFSRRRRMPEAAALGVARQLSGEIGELLDTPVPDDHAGFLAAAARAYEARQQYRG